MNQNRDFLKKRPNPILASQIGITHYPDTTTGLFPRELRTNARVRKFSGFFEFSISTF